MINHFMDLGLERATNFPIYTLGPQGTSSEYASNYFSRWMKEKYQADSHSITLNDSYEEARANLVQKKGVLVVANAYPQVNDFYMDPRLELLATFVLNTPLYGLVIKVPLPDRPLNVATHPAPIPLINELLPAGLSVGQIIAVKSTSAAAAAVANGEADMALTTETATRLHGLKVVSATRPIRMLWSVFSS